MKSRNKFKNASKDARKEFSEHARKPVFILGATFWVAMLLFFAFSSIVSFRTANVVNSQEVFGISGAYIFIGLFVVLGVLLFFVWKYMIKRKKK